MFAGVAANVLSRNIYQEVSFYITIKVICTAEPRLSVKTMLSENLYPYNILES